MDEIASLVPIYGGISYERIEDQGIQWPCPTKDHPGTTTLYTDLFARPGGLAKFMALDHKGPAKRRMKNIPFVLITGRMREHYNNGSMTGRVPGIMELVPEELLEINAKDAEALQIKNGDRVSVASRRGEIKVKAKVTERSQPGNVFLTFHFRNALTNILTSEHRDPITGTPEYKSCAVKIEKFLDEQASVSHIDDEIRDSRIDEL